MASPSETPNRHIPHGPVASDAAPRDEGPSRARNVVGWVFMLVSSVVVGTPLLIVLALLYPFGMAHRAGDAVVHWWVHTLLRLWRVTLEVDGLEHIDPAQTYVIVANHRSHLDAVAIIVALYPRLHFGFIVKRSLTLIPIWGWCIWLNGYFPVDRDRKGRGNQLNGSVRALRRGRSVLIFPEGTRVPGHPFRAFKKGAAIMATEAGIPILPVTVSGTGALLPRSSWMVRPGRVRVDIQAPIAPLGADPEARAALLQRTRDTVASRYRLDVAGAPLSADPALFQRMTELPPS